MKNNVQKAKEHEEFIAKLYGGRRSKSSGASFHDPIDVTTDSMVIECEYTENKSYSLKKSFWKEVVNKTHSSKQPALAIRFLDLDTGDSIDLLVISVHDDVEDRENYVK